MASSSTLDDSIYIRWLAQDIWGGKMSKSHFWPMAPVIIAKYTLNDVRRGRGVF